MASVFPMNLPHYLTLLRIFISPIFPLLYLEREALGISFTLLPFLLLGFLVVSEISDVLDGLLARRRNEVTDLGKLLDPMADSITHISLFLTFTQGFVKLPLLVVLIFLYRDLFVGTLRTLCALRGVALAARFSGKMKAIIQACSALFIVLLMIPYTQGWLSLEAFQQASFLAASIAALYTALSVGDYFYANWGHIRKAL